MCMDYTYSGNTSKDSIQIVVCAVSGDGTMHTIVFELNLGSLVVCL
jgi:hypothetical protein